MVFADKPTVYKESEEIRPTGEVKIEPPITVKLTN